MSAGGRSARKIRIEIAQLAAKLMAVDGVSNYLAAKRKAALQLGIRQDRNMPTNLEIEQALADYERLFQADVQPAALESLRRTAVEAMTFLKPFRPRLVGPVLNGTATKHSDVTLHLYAEAVEDVGFFLDDHAVPHTHTEVSIRTRENDSLEFPAIRFIAGQDSVVLVVFREKQRYMTPLSPVDGKTMRRAALREVKTLLNRA
ncbi:MAG: hypothetical protein ACREUU_13900 [Gammaproteobacteria bacterium]